ncbi:FAD-binding oxidoreductase [Tuberibacillus sp. Marseille-P3662]|uniref:FAD-binding oxidoreductase n=1 Tax=Tuberibacillus sp. Marseille-P3662 TaxID=1965358 RepID=UPI000A1CB927|nr:FAD-linked oxidase C-terminal domain-containing protein [Tuberibacillus sp. Marseille-P3662]
MTVEVEALKSLLGGADQVKTGPSAIDEHGRDMTYHPLAEPEAVVFPQSTEDVAEVVKWAVGTATPIVPYGVGSSLEGHILPVEGGISVDFAEMNQVIDIRPDDFMVKVQPGVTRHQLNQSLKRYGLFFPVDPGADASLGGMAATNASGTNTVCYGGMRQNTLALKVVMADGRVIDVGSEALKTSAGYDLKDLIIGSEGTLGVITELTLKLTGIPEVTKAGKAVFSSVRDAGAAAENILKAGLPVSRMELVDEYTVAAVNEHSQTDYPEAPSLFLEFAGGEQAVNEQIDFAQDIMQSENLVSMQFEADEQARNELWRARHEAALAVVGLTPGKMLTSTDVAVPISELTEAIVTTRQLLDQHHYTQAALFGHVGDGNFHVVIGVDRDNLDEVAAYKEVNHQIVDYALSKGGTSTGEHGVGIGKREYLLKEHGQGVDVMKTIKQALDPKHLLNPGKIFLD